LTPTIQSTIEIVAELARRKGLDLILEVDRQAPQFLCGDASRLRQVLLNLLSNAIKFTERGEIGVKIDKLSENSNEAVLRFEVHDTGIGIPTEKQHLLFQPFTQVDASTTRHFGGTGLGLSIARELVTRMGGTIAVTSAAGAGSAFWFTAKLAKQTDAPRSPVERFESLEGVRILVVDDNSHSREILGRQAQSWGMKVDTAASAEQAMAALRAATGASRFQAALIDVMMPDVDGVELVRRIQCEPELRQVILILVSSAGARNQFAVRLQGLELAAWLMKPVQESVLYNTLIEALGRTTPAEQPPSALLHPGAPNDAQKSQPGKVPGGRALRVLVAEDNPINQKLVRLMLIRMGADVDTVANGREAVEAVLRLPYDLVFMDCQMPEMDGYDASREIRRRQGASGHTRIVALTAHALQGDRDKCLDAGMDAYITKPLQKAVLESMLRESAAAAVASRPECGDGADAAAVVEATPAPVDGAPAAGEPRT
jgi:two-component system, sensor histidine kinase and response regulator